jgi:hypothetical protein
MLTNLFIQEKDPDKIVPGNYCFANILGVLPQRGSRVGHVGVTKK